MVACTLAACIALPVSAQDEREAPDDEEKREIVIERDGNVYRFRVPDDDDPARRRWQGGERPFRADTVIDGRRVIRFRLPGGDEETFEFEVPGFGDEGFREHLMPEIERFRVVPPDRFLERDGEPFGFRMRGLMDGLHGFDGLPDEARREMLELERRSQELAAEARRAEGGERDELERELDEVLAQLFDVRGQMREAQAERLEERAERLREEAGALREALRDRDRERRALIDERKRELLGEPGADW
jgi:hypothetical protein